MQCISSDDRSRSVINNLVFSRHESIYITLQRFLSVLIRRCNLSPMAVCPRCNKRPSKRQCPALRTKICAICCSRERMIELACPESCSYLIEARSSASQREMALRRKETATDPRDMRLSERGLLALNGIQRAIINAQRGIGTTAFRDLDDAEMLAAVENTIKNLETEESGLIYEHRAPSHRIAELSRRIREGLDEIGKETPVEERPRRTDVLKALTFMREAVDAHIRRAAGDPEASRTFIRYITLFYPWPEQATAPLIV
jgi:hypothetical protein